MATMTPKGMVDMRMDYGVSSMEGETDRGAYINLDTMYPTDVEDPNEQDLEVVGMNREKNYLLDDTRMPLGTNGPAMDASLDVQEDVRTPYPIEEYVAGTDMGIGDGFDAYAASSFYGSPMTPSGMMTAGIGMEDIGLSSHSGSGSMVGSSILQMDLPMQTMSYQQIILPDVIRNFILFFHRHLLEGNVYELGSIYENSFTRLTERFFQRQPWPPAEIIAPYVDSDPVFLILYKELYYRHLYSKLQPSLDDRFASYENYCDLFNYVLNSPGPIALELPNQWLWDIIDEFIYQFQSFCKYRSMIKNKTEEELFRLKSNPQIWNVHSVLNVLYSLIEKSDIERWLMEQSEMVSGKNEEELERPIVDSAKPISTTPFTPRNEYAGHSLYRMLGYFSKIGLLRVHCLLGDYTLALQMVDRTEISSKRGLFTKVTACHIAVYYYVGFAYTMLRCYQDAIKAFSHILLFISRTKQYHARSYQYDQIPKKSEQMYSLLAMTITLCPQKIDDTVMGILRGNHAEKMARLQRGDESCYEECFKFACPKFISPCPPNYDVYLNNPTSIPTLSLPNPKHFQWCLFWIEIQQQLMIPPIRSLLKLYTTMSIRKLAQFLDMDPEEFRQQLLCYKHKTVQHKRPQVTLLNDSLRSNADLDFYIEEDVVHVVESKPARRFSEFFVRQIQKLDTLMGNLQQRGASFN